MELHQSVRLRKEELEWQVSALAVYRPEEALGMNIYPELFDNEKLKGFWKDFTASRDATKSALDNDIMAELLSKDEVFTFRDLESFVTKLREEAWLYRMASNLPTLASSISTGNAEKVRETWEALQFKEQQPINLPDTGDVAAAFLSSVGARKMTIKTRIQGIDNGCGGLWYGILSVVGARPSVGKTALTFQIARNVAENKQKVIYFSMEMNNTELLARAACGMIRIEITDLMSGNMTNEQKDNLWQVTGQIADTYRDYLLIPDKPITTNEIRAIVAREKPELVIVDHIRLCTDPTPKSGNEVQRLGIISQNLKDIAKDFGCHVMACVQLNRGLEGRQDKHPSLADIRDSGQIEENADLIFGLHRDRIYIEQATAKSPADLRVLKFRNGPSNIQINLAFDGVGQVFEKRDF